MGSGVDKLLLHFVKVDSEWINYRYVLFNWIGSGYTTATCCLMGSGVDKLLLHFVKVDREWINYRYVLFNGIGSG